MKKSITLILSALLIFTMLLSLAGCGEEITLESQTAGGVTLDVPSDFDPFTDNTTFVSTTNKDSTAAIVISAPIDAQGYTAADFDMEVYQATQMASYSSAEFIEFDTDAQLDGVPALFAHTTGINGEGVEMELFNYMVFFNDGSYQSIAISFVANTENSMKDNIDAVLSSIKY